MLDPAGPTPDGPRCPAASGSGSIPSRTPQVAFASFALSATTALEWGKQICLQDTGTNVWPKSPDGPVRLPPLVPGAAFSNPVGQRSALRRGSAACPRRKRNRWEKQLKRSRREVHCRLRTCQEPAEQQD